MTRVPWIVVAAVAAVAVVTSCTFGASGGAGQGALDSGKASGDAVGTTSVDSPVTSTPLPTSMGGEDSGQPSTTAGAADAGTASSAGPEATDGSTQGDGSGTSGATGEPPPVGPFGAPVLIDELSEPDANEDDPTLRFDELEIYFDSDRGSESDIWVAIRDDIDSTWDAPVPAVALNSQGGADTTPKLAPNGLLMIISSDRDGSFDPYISTREAVDAAWSEPTLLGDLASPSEDFASSVFGDVLYVCSNRDGTIGSLDVWQVEVLDASVTGFGPAQNVTALNGPGEDCSVGMVVDGLELFVERRESGGDWELWRSTRADPSSDWESPQPAEALNSTDDDNDPWLSTDAHRLYMASTRNGFGNQNLFLATR